MATAEAPFITLHALAPSPPCMTIESALRLKGLEYKRVDLQPGPHIEAMEGLYGEGRTTVPGVLLGDEPVHGSTVIMPRIDALADGVSLYPEPIAEAVREAELWGDSELQTVARRLPWGAMHFRPESLGTFGGRGPLDGPGTDFAIKLIRGTWRHHGISAVLLEEYLGGLVAKLDHVEALIADGVIGGAEPNAADLQIGACLRVLLTVGDVVPLIEGRPTGELARRLFPDYAGLVPAGAFPAGWVPTR